MTHLQEKINAETKIMEAHDFLVKFVAKFDHAKRGGIHDFMEMAISNMISTSVKNIDEYLQTGYKSVKPQEIMAIFAESSQKVLDDIKRNLDGLDRVNFR